MKTVEESGLSFGPFEEGYLFEVEKSALYLAIRENVPIAEFVLLRSGETNHIITVEAKSSSPQPGNQVNFDAFISEIGTKLTNTFSLLHALILKRHPEFTEEIPANFLALDLGSCAHALVLVINGHKDEWLPPLQDALRQELHALVKTWGLGPQAVMVLNDGMARQKNLIA